jgi:hypothetical protein
MPICNPCSRFICYLGARIDHSLTYLLSTPISHDNFFPDFGTFPVQWWWFGLRVESMITRVPLASVMIQWSISQDLYVEELPTWWRTFKWFHAHQYTLLYKTMRFKNSQQPQVSHNTKPWLIYSNPFYKIDLVLTHTWLVLWQPLIHGKMTNGRNQRHPFNVWKIN